MVRKLKILFLLVLAAAVVSAAATMNLQKNCVSELNNSMLPEWDPENLTGESIDNYIQNRIGFHDIAITGYINLQDRLFGELVHPSYMYGKDGYVFARLSETSVDTEFIDAFCKYLRQVQDYCEVRGVPFLYCVNPGKTTVYKEYLPDGYVYKNDFLDALSSKLDEYNVHWISNVELLEEKAETEQVYNRKYDANHWNDLGQFYGTNHMLEVISEDFPAVKVWEFSDFSVTEEIKEYLPNSHFRVDEAVPRFSFLDKSKGMDIAEKYNGISLDKRHQGFVAFQRTDAAVGLPKVLFFHGSYYNRSQEFYAYSFKEAYGVHNYENFINFDYYFNIFQPDYVILETAEYATSRNYFDYEKLAQKQLNPLFEEVKELPHEEFRLKELDAEVTQMNALRQITFYLPESYSYGYLEKDGQIFDLKIEGQTISCTISQEMNKMDDVTVYLFSESIQ